MIRLRVLGALGLQAGSGADVHPILSQPKRIALLTYLVIASRDGAVRRDTVLALFWPELDTERARHALRQSLYHLRRELGADVITGNGDDQLLTNPTLLQCDAVEFSDASHARAHERALEFYRGELLPGFYVQGSVEFEQWLDSTRARLREQALAAASELCTAAQQSNKKADAVRWARRAHELAPFDEPVLRRLLETLEAAGDGGAAVIAYDAFAERSERELGVAPAAETVAIIERIRARATTGRKSLKRRSTETVAAHSAAAAPVQPRRTWMWASVVVTVLAVAVLFVAARAGDNPPLDPDLIAITPFHVMGPREDTLLSRIVAELLAVDLQTTSGPRTVDVGVTAYRFLHAPQHRREGDARGLARDISRSLGAGLVLHGTVLERDSSIVIVASLEDVKTGEVRADGRVEGRAAPVSPLVANLAIQLFGTIIGEDPQRLLRFTSSSDAAVRAYLEGSWAARRGNFEPALRLLNRALELDSSFAAAALALVDVTGWMGRSAEQGRYESIARAHRDRLGAADQLHLYAWAGPESRPPNANRMTVLFDATAEAYARLPDHPEVLYLFGDRHYHLGDGIRVADPVGRARTLMERALALDSIAAAREHLVELAVLTNDEEAARRYRALILAKEPNALRTPYIRWLAANYLREAGEQRRMRAALDTMNSLALSLVRHAAQDFGLGVEDAERAARILLERTVTTPEHTNARNLLVSLLHQRGRHAAADSLLPPTPIPATPTQGLLRTVILDLFSTENVGTGQASADELIKRAASPAVAQMVETERGRAELMRIIAGTEVWKIQHGDTLTAAASLAQLQRMAPFTTDNDAANHRGFVAIVDGLLEHRRLPLTKLQRRPALERLDTMARGSLPAGALAQLVYLHILGELGASERALAASAAHTRNLGFFVAWLPTLLRLEARFAAATGDKDRALQAYRKYLALRNDPDPALIPQADSVRAEYERLLRNRRTQRTP